MKEFGRRALAVVLAVLLLGLCACSAKTEPAQEETAASEAAAEPAQEAAKPEEAPATEAVSYTHLRRRHHLLQKRLRLSVRGRENAGSGGQVYPASAERGICARKDGTGPYGGGSGGRQCGAQPSVGEVFR